MARRSAEVEIIPAKRRAATAPKRPSEVRYITLPPEDERAPELFDGLEAGSEAEYVDAALQGVMTDLGATDDDAKVTVWRLVAAQGVRRQEWLFECHPREFSIPQLQTDFGPGDYRVRVYGKQEGTNYRIVHADKRLSIGEARGAKKAEGLAGVPAVAVKDDLSRAMAEALAGPLNMMAQLLAQATKAPSRAEVLEEMKQMREIFGGGAQAPQADPFMMLERALALVKSSAPAAPLVNEDGEVAPGAIISQGIGLMRELFEAGRAGRVNGAQPTPALPVPTPEPSTGAVHAPMAPAQPIHVQPQGESEMGLVLKAQLAMLLHAAKQGMETATYAGLIYEQAPDEVLDKLVGESWWAELLKLEPRFAEHREWCEKLRGEVLAIFKEETGDESAALTADAQPGINPGDAKPS